MSNIYSTYQQNSNYNSRSNNSSSSRSSRYNRNRNNQSNIFSSSNSVTQTNNNDGSGSVTQTNNNDSSSLATQTNNLESIISNFLSEISTSSSSSTTTSLTTCLTQFQSLLSALCSSISSSSSSSSTSSSSSSSSTQTSSSTTGISSNDEALLQKYNISQSEINAVAGQNLDAEDSNGNAEFVIAQGSDDNKYHIYELLNQKYDTSREWSQYDQYQSVVQVSNGNNILYTKQDTQNQGLTVITDTSSSQNGSGTGSPLILDTNHDGTISSQAGKGVDINGDGTVKGEATNGDSMLAMKFKSGNIDGTEVFGNNTVNPFTGKACNASNGFDALKQVAESAQQATGIQIINNGEVNVQKLNQAMESSGKGSLGLISGNNTSTLKGLGDVAEINTSYTNGSYNTNSSVQNRQIGSYTASSGKTYGADDVWFTSV